MMSRALIEQAKGIVMERHKVTAAEASTILTRASQRTNTKLQDVAAELVRTGVLRVPVDAQSYRPSGRKVSP
jgi:AmiR/NasT family two-component response regulator